MDCKTRAMAKSFQLLINSLGLKMAVLALRSAIRANAMPLCAVSGCTRRAVSSRFYADWCRFGAPISIKLRTFMLLKLLYKFSKATCTKAE
jgi:hypothetical protein